MTEGTTKLEQIAKAMEAAHKASTSYLDLARVAVEEFREPGEGVVQIYNDIACEGFSPESSLNLTAFGIMLDAILNEKPND